MPIVVRDGSESINGQLGATLSPVTAAFAGTVTGGTAIQGQLNRALGPIVPSLSGAVTAPAGGSFDWTHGLGALQLDAAAVMGPRWGVGASSTKYIDSLADLTPYEEFRTFFSTLGDYVTYNVTPPTDYNCDLFIDFRSVSLPLMYPLHIGKWRHVIILGVELSLIIQSTAFLLQYEPTSTRGNELFTCANKDYAGPLRTNWTPGKNLSQVNDQTFAQIYYNNPGAYPAAFDSDRLPYKGWNIHPRMAGACVIRLSQAGYCWIEGCRLNANGQQGDGIIVALDSGLTGAQANANRRNYIQNTRIENYDGQSTHKNFGDGIHGDSLHSQGGAENSEYYENIWVISGQEGNVHTSWPSGTSLQYHFARNYQYILLPAATNWRNLNDYAPPGEKSNGAAISNPFASSAQENSRWNVYNMWVSGKSSNIYKLSDKAIGFEHPQINSGISPKIFAPTNHTGVNYNTSSPHNSFFNGL